MREMREMREMNGTILKWSPCPSCPLWFLTLSVVSHTLWFSYCTTMEVKRAVAESG
jgi:hypothetical protein